ncbi:MAG: thermonuclease family protein [Archangiaceae bacterium]|nr:thermonuclease family protein [Archangiaceae bacterium]
MMLSLALVALLVPTAGVHHKKHNAEGTVVLNGERTAVNWTDGDSFKIKDGKYKGAGTRLQGYNTLEAYGPVHRWGEWSTHELFEIAEDSSAHAAQQTWECTTDGNKDGYGRLLILCPALVKHMVIDGYAMVYTVDDKPVSAETLAWQQEAIKNKAGMWKKGAPKGVITSLHALGEADSNGAPTAYNRVADTRTGKAVKREHTNRYDTCQEVCEKTDGEESCMVYVPFEKRYKYRPTCLQ